MSEFSKFGKKKLALAMACVSALGGKTSAMNNHPVDINRTGVKGSQPLGAVGGVAFGNIRNSSNNNKVIDWIKNNKALTATILTLVFGAGGAGLFFGLRSNKQEETRKQYFEIYKKILNSYLSNNSLDGVIEKNEGNLFQGNILFVLGGMQIFGDFKNNEAVFSAGKEGEYELKVKFNISEDKKTLHLEIDEKTVANNKITKYKLDLKIPEISENEDIKFDDNAVRCKILCNFGVDFFGFELKNENVAVEVSEGLKLKDELWQLISSVAQGVEKNWAKVFGEPTLSDGKKAKKIRSFVEISEDFKTCVMQDVFYEDEECKNAIVSNKWEFDIKLK